MRLWEAESGSEIRSLSAHSGRVWSVAFNHDGSVLASGSDDGTVRLWEVESGSEIRSLSGHSDYVNSVAFNHDGSVLASGSDDGTVRLWDSDRGALLAELWGFANRCWAVRTPTEEGWILRRGDDGMRFRIRRPPTWEAEPLLPPRPASEPRLVALSPLQPIVLGEGSDGARHLTVRVKNEGRGPAYWVRAFPKWPEGLGVHASSRPVHTRLDPGEEVELPLLLSRVTPSDRANPGAGPTTPRFDLEVRVTSAHPDGGGATRLAIPVECRVPRLEVASVALLRDENGVPSALGVTLTNRGQQQSPALRITVDGAPAEAEIRAQRIGVERSIEPLAPGEVSRQVSFELPEDFKEGVDVLAANIDVRGLWPSHRWTSTHDVDLKPSRLLLVTALGLLLIVFLGAGYFQLVHRHPLVLELSRDPGKILEFSTSQVVAVDRSLRRARRLDQVLLGAGIAPARWHALLEVPGDPAQTLAQDLGARLEEPEPVEHALGLTVHRMELPGLPVRVDSETLLFMVTDEPPPDLAARLREECERRGQATRYTFFLDGSPEQSLGTHLGEQLPRVIVLDENELLRVILADDPRDEFCKHLASRARLGELSPYQTGGGLDRAELFFGRANELALLESRARRNCLLVGARQMGKSSILKQLARTHPDNTHFVTLAGADPWSALAAKDLPDPRSLPPAPDASHPPLFLLDEADAFIAADASGGYPVCGIMRALAEEGRARFVLAGFRELYSSAYLEHGSPLRNFGESIVLGPLDPTSGRRLATKPLEPLGVEYADDALVDELLERTGRRANLIAIACDAALRMLPPLSDRILTAEIVHGVLDVSDDAGKAIQSALASLLNLIDDPRLAALDRMVMFATTRNESFERDDVRSAVERVGARVSADELQASLDRLVLGYVVRRTRGRYAYPIPLIREYLLDRAGGDPEMHLDDQARAWR